VCSGQGRGLQMLAGTGGPGPYTPGVTELATAFAMGFLIGTLPAAWVIVHFTRSKDVSSQGSGNVGALNALRVARSKWVGISVMILDMLKGAAAVWAAAWWFGWDVYGPLGAATVGVVGGHNYNPWLSWARGKLVGGKGFAAASGALFVVTPWVVPAWLGSCVLAWVFFRKTHGIVDEAPASAVATLACVGWGYLLYDVSVAWTCLGIFLLCMPKIWPELRVLFAASPESVDEAPRDA